MPSCISPPSPSPKTGEGTVDFFSFSLSSGAEHIAHLLCWTQGVPESLAASQFSALKGPGKVAQGRGSEATAALGMGRRAVGPSPRGPCAIGRNPLPTRGEGSGAGSGEWGRTTSSPGHPDHPPVSSSLTYG